MFCMHPSLHYKTTLHIDYTTQTVYKSMTYYSCKKTVILVTSRLQPALPFCDSYYGNNFQLTLLPYYSKTATEYFTLS